MPQLTDLHDVRPRLEQDRPWSAFSLADLAPPYATHAMWFGPSEGRSVVLLYGAYEPPLVVCHGLSTECDVTLAEADVVRRTAQGCLNVRPDLLPMASLHFTSFERRRMVRLIAIAGTHVVSRATSVGALGNVYTRRDRRRRGLALEVASAVTAELVRSGISTIVLNIIATNTPARRVYERIGFGDYCEFYEGAAVR